MLRDGQGLEHSPEAYRLRELGLFEITQHTRITEKAKM